MKSLTYAAAGHAAGLGIAVLKCGQQHEDEESEEKSDEEVIDVYTARETCNFSSCLDRVQIVAEDDSVKDRARFCLAIHS